MAARARRGGEATSAPRRARRLLTGAVSLLLGLSAPVARAQQPPSASGGGAQPAQSAPASSETEGAIQTPPSSVANKPETERLSNERTLTTWAHPLLTDWIHSQPETRSPRIGRIHLWTEDGFPEVYVLLAARDDALGRQWVKLRIPGRPNGRVGWVMGDALGGFHHTHWLIVVDRRERRLTAYFEGHVRMIAPVGIGKPSTPTPAGRFWIRERFKLTDRGSPYGPYALGTSDYSTLSEWPGGGVVGIHGDFGEPQKIPGDPSHGCIRMRDGDLAWLAPRITLGTPVEVL